MPENEHVPESGYATEGENVTHDYTNSGPSDPYAPQPDAEPPMPSSEHGNIISPKTAPTKAVSPNVFRQRDTHLSAPPKTSSQKGAPPKGAPPKSAPPKSAPPRGAPSKGSPPNAIPPKAAPSAVASSQPETSQTSVPLNRAPPKDADTPNDVPQRARPPPGPPRGPAKGAPKKPEPELDVASATEAENDARSESEQHPPAMPHFHKVAGDSGAPLGDGLISTMDVLSPPAPAPAAAKEEEEGEEETDTDDLGLGNSRPKEDKPEHEEKPAPKEEPKEAPKAESRPSGSWLGRLLGTRSSNDKEPKAKKAHLGEETSFYYDKELKRWVNKKAGDDGKAAAAPLPPPPKARKDPSEAGSAGPPGRKEPPAGGAPAPKGDGPPARGSGAGKKRAAKARYVVVE